MMNIKRIGAIFEKDLKDFMKNMMLILMPVVPIVLSLFYRQMGVGEEMPLSIIYIIVGVVFTTVTANCIMAMMAEEKEKKTLHGLTMSPASFLDVIIGKSLVTGLMTLITLVISLTIIGMDPILNIRGLVGLILLFLFFLLIGIGVGLFAKSVSTTSAYIMPIMFAFGFTPMIEFMNLSKDNLALRISDAFPLPQLISMSETETWMPLFVVTIWVLGAALFTYICFKKTQKFS